MAPGRGQENVLADPGMSCGTNNEEAKDSEPTRWALTHQGNGAAILWVGNYTRKLVSKGKDSSLVLLLFLCTLFLQPRQIMVEGNVIFLGKKKNSS